MKNLWFCEKSVDCEKLGMKRDSLLAFMRCLAEYYLKFQGGTKFKF